MVGEAQDFAEIWFCLVLVEEPCLPARAFIVFLGRSLCPCVTRPGFTGTLCEAPC